MASIQLQEVSFSYQHKGEVYPALKHVDLEIKEGEFVCVIGASGCGKSTLITLLEGLNFPTAGKVLIGGREVTGPGKDRCIVFQHYSLFAWLTAKKNVVFGIRQVRRDLSKSETEDLAQEYLERVGLQGYENKYPQQLSGGQQQRVAIARALAMDPDILLMDEPFGAIDTKNRMLLQDLLLELCESERKKRTVVFITHDVDEALYLADRIIFMQPGKIVRDIPIEFGKHRVRAAVQASDRYGRLRNQLVGLFYEEIAEAVDGEAYL
ncbi:Bicarbonate transport ATP-binding protein CmpD [bioreactor metagenome]|uniref:Bicarbonate transport ATP-binding protein CmpD n=1 Tax=bioreactor metagenome TaxID=1076179 RepID=A0A645A667_9ZZZZ